MRDKRLVRTRAWWLTTGGLVWAAAGCAFSPGWSNGVSSGHQGIVKSVLHTRRHTDDSTGHWLNRPVIPRTGLATRIPRNAEYLEVVMADQRRDEVSVAIGHQLTTQGVGIQEHGPHFFRSGDRVTVYIPMGVVFETGANSDLFAYFPPPSRPVPQKPDFVWLLMYGEPINAYVMTGGPLSTRDLVTWDPEIQRSRAAVKRYVPNAEKHGWHVFQTVNMQHNLTGALGYNGWAEIPVGVPVNLVNAMGYGNEIFEIKGVISERALLLRHPELRADIEAASRLSG
ncbi:MAG: hypothetical protein IRZ33_09545 [Alicyclobacillaceae bacterium]|nr:hypothetical protein [Alicyclobacillaceae bacterium]